MQWTLKSFRSSSAGHLEAAERILEPQSKKGRQAPGLTPGSAAYLAHVALECAMKARLLWRAGCADTEKLQTQLPKVHRTHFAGKQGHNLRKHAAELGLAKLVKEEGHEWSDDDCWHRMCGGERPYSLRYAGEEVNAEQAREELDRATKLREILVSGISSRLKKLGEQAKCPIDKKSKRKGSK
ncbi:MAG: hypothetical protein RBU37_19870 [Myxococcota bacterium]|jgi:hypothetical protein|nr:hypothetical protein [Myxococcota bacterium]